MYKVYACLFDSMSEGSIQVLVGKFKDLVDAVMVCARFGFSGYIVTPDDERLTFAEAEEVL